jgi:sugar phosphate isomerase/epimerase
MNNRAHLSRREFLAQTALAAASAALWPRPALAAAPYVCPPIAVFSKIYQELKLDFDQAAALTAEAGLQGVDCPVRPGGEILPERATDDIPRYAEALRRRKTGLLLLTTAIASPATPHAEAILRAAKKEGVRYYRVNWMQVPREGDVSKQLAEIKAGLKDLAALNKELGLTAVYQNHSATSPTAKNRYIGGDLNELHTLVKEFDPSQIGVAFDLGHALLTHGDEWPGLFEKLKSHVQLAYVKDAKKGGRFPRFGEGEFNQTDWFARLKAMNYRAPFSMHIEFDWTGPDKARTRQALLKALQESAAKLREWVAKA